MLSSEGQENPCPIMLYPADTVHRSQCTETFTNVMPSSEYRALTLQHSQCTHTFTNVMRSSECRTHTVCNYSQCTETFTNACRVLNVGQKPSPIILYPHTVHRSQCTELSPTLCPVLSVEHSRCTPVSALTLSSTLCSVLYRGSGNSSPIMKLYRPDTVHPGQCTETFTNVLLSPECWTHTVQQSVH